MKLDRLIDRTDSLTGITGTINSPTIDLEGARNYSIQAIITVGAPTAKVLASATDVNTTTDTFTSTAHGFTTGLKVQVSTTVTLPAPLAAVTDYFVIVVDANNFKLAASLANALAGTQIDITTTGTGDQTVTPTALAGASVKLQKSNNGSNWIDDAAATAITASTSLIFEKVDPSYKYARLQYTLTAGVIAADNLVLSKG